VTRRAPTQSRDERSTRELLICRAGYFAVVLCVSLGGFSGVMSGMVMMAIGHMRMMRGHMMVTGFVMARRFAMMPRGVFVVFGCFVMMLGCFSGHLCFLHVRSLHWAGGTRLNP
jgi:hypothetical protein